jgi:peptidyl-dipeptidase Dcp
MKLLLALLATSGIALSVEAEMTNPLLPKWIGPYGGVPPFDQVKVEHFKPALEAAMAEQLTEIDKIANDPAPPSFENTIAALERSGRAMQRVKSVYGVFGSTMSTAAFQDMEREMEPRLAAFQDRIIQNEMLFKRISAVYEAREKSSLTAEQKRLVWLKYTTFARHGARLDKAAKEKLSAINQRLATLYTQFSQNVLADENTATLLESQADLAGLPESLRTAAAEAARERGQAGKWAIVNTRSSVDPFLSYSSRRDLREKVWRAFTSRGDNGDGRDNKKIIAEIVRLRGERAAVLGYPSHAHWRLEMSMAKTPERATQLMEAVWRPAVKRVTEEVADMQAIADKSGTGIAIEPWDYRYYAEKVRKAKYDIDEDEVMPYLQLEKLREAMFWVAGELLGLRFTPVANVPVYHPDVRVWQVKDDTGKHVALFYFDPYARPDKSSGAWMNAYRNQERFDGEVTTIVSNNSNFVKGKPGEPILVSWDDARTLFHEFGHALHGLASNVSYPSLSGTNVDRDYVEFPSQLLEFWLATPEVLNKYARHWRTNEPIPQELVKKIERASKFNKGYENVEYLSSALVDMRMHLAPERVGDIAAFERETLTALGMPKQMAMRHRLPHFGHLFNGDSYSAGYYSYLWADTLSADAFEAFTEAGSAYDKTVAKKLREHVFSIGNTIDPAEGYRAFRGRDAKIDALMRRRGFGGSPSSSSPASSSPSP